MTKVGPGLYEFLIHRLEQIAQDPECLASVREIVHWQYPDEVITAEGAAARAAKLAQSLGAFVTSTIVDVAVYCPTYVF